MKTKEKIKNIKTTVGIHTLNGTADTLVDLRKADKNPLVTECNYRKIKNQEDLETYIRINPNMNNGHVLTEYSTQKKIVDDILEDLKTTDFKLNRVDLSFNSLEPDFYEKYLKVFRLLIACISNSSNDKNSTDSKNFWSGKTKSLYTKNQIREVEFYNRKEKDEKSPYYARLELRSRRVKSDIKHEFLDLWFKRLDDALKEFEAVQYRYNLCFAEEYLLDIARKKRYRRYLSLNSFLMEKSDLIFTRDQMMKLLIMLGFSEKKARNKVYNFKKNHDIEFFTISDLEYVVNYIKEEITKYFSK